MKYLKFKSQYNKYPSTKVENHIAVCGYDEIANILNVSTDYLLSIDNKRYLDVSDLNEETIQHLQLIIEDIKKSAKN